MVVKRFIIKLSAISYQLSAGPTYSLIARANVSKHASRVAAYTPPSSPPFALANTSDILALIRLSIAFAKVFDCSAFISVSPW